MQNAAFRALGLDWTYALLDVEPAGLVSAVASLRAQDVAGANVTIPYKQDVMQLLDTIDPEAVRVGAVNTIVNSDGALNGSNTDVAGLRHALQALGIEPVGISAVILGTGGSARAAAAALAGAHLTFGSRHPRDAGMPGLVLGWDDPRLAAASRSAAVLVNATPLGRHGEMPLRPAALPSAGAVIDLVYVRGGTPLVRKARSLGLPAADGWDVLLAQGARSFEMWTGKPAPVEAMRQALQP